MAGTPAPDPAGLGQGVVILGGHGAVGRLFAGLLLSEGPVALADRQGSYPVPGTRSVLADATQLSDPLRDLLSTADVVVVALPEAACLAALPAVAGTMRAGALLVDTLSVKTTIVPVMTDLAARHGLEAVSLNPMFAPSLGFANRPVAVVPVRGGRRSARLIDLLEDRGARPVVVSSAQHDRLTAALQAATHASIIAFGQAMIGLDLDVGALLDLAPPPYRVMLAMLARITSGQAEVYRDIQAGNPGAARARAALSEGLRRVDAAAVTSPEDFGEIMSAVSRWLGPYREHLAYTCARLFGSFGN